MNSKISYPDFSWGSVNKYGVFITLVHWVHSMVEPCGRVPSRCSLWTSLVSGILQANLHIKSLVMRVGNVVCFLKFLKTRDSWNVYYFLLNNRVINAGIITKRRGHVRPHGKIYIYNSNPKLIFITEKQNSSYDATVNSYLLQKSKIAVMTSPSLTVDTERSQPKRATWVLQPIVSRQNWQFIGPEDSHQGSHQSDAKLNNRN